MMLRKEILKQYPVGSRVQCLSAREDIVTMTDDFKLLSNDPEWVEIEIDGTSAILWNGDMWASIINDTHQYPKVMMCYDTKDNNATTSMSISEKEAWKCLVLSNYKGRYQAVLYKKESTDIVNFNYAMEIDEWNKLYNKPKSSKEIDTYTDNIDLIFNLQDQINELKKKFDELLNNKQYKSI